MMILALLPYLQWKFIKQSRLEAGKIIVQWFKPSACSRAEHVYWDLREECVKNSSDQMLEQVGIDTNDLYWEEAPPMPKCKQVAADKESINNSISTVKTVARQKKKAPQSSLKSSTSKSKETQEVTISDNSTVMSQQTSISQLTEQISAIKVENKQIIDHFDNLAAQLEAFMNNQQPQTTRCHARGHVSDFGQAS